MKDEQILSLLKDALVYADEEKAGLANKMDLNAKLTDLGIESIAAMEMAGYVEEKLGILFPDDELAAVSTVKGFVNLIKKNLPATV